MSGDKLPIEECDPKDELPIAECDLQQLRCSVCNDYLSSAPIRALPDGNNICGRCSLPNSDVIAYRVLLLETMLSNIVFPCKFKQYGCTNCPLFGNTAEHEANCDFQPLICASSPYTDCSWTGSIIQAVDHFAENHPTFIQWDAEFKLQIDEDKEGISMAVKKIGAYIIKYMYDSSKTILKYNVRFLMANVDDQFCKIQITNDSDTEYKVQVKGSKCSVLNQNFFNVENMTVLDLKNLLQILNNPKNITLTFYVTLPHGDVDNINYDLLDSLRCSKCQYYLVPPIYEMGYDQSKICIGCKDSFSCVLSNDEDLQNLLAKQNYPCPWKSCKFVTKGDAIRNHSMQCRYRIYNCLYPKCKYNKDFPSTIQHYIQNHNSQQFDKEYIYTVTIEGSSGFRHCTREECAISIIDREIILMKFDTDRFNHKLELYTTKSKQEISCTVNFKCLRRCFCANDFTFSTNNRLNVRLDYLSPCFQERDILTATLRLLFNI